MSELYLRILLQLKYFVTLHHCLHGRFRYGGPAVHLSVSLVHKKVNSHCRNSALVFGSTVCSVRVLLTPGRPTRQKLEHHHWKACQTHTLTALMMAVFQKSPSKPWQWANIENNRTLNTAFVSLINNIYALTVVPCQIFKHLNGQFTQIIKIMSIKTVKV